jgi:hypothetical protein
MEITPGLAAVTSAIRIGQDRFDQAAARVTEDALAAADPASSAEAGQLPADLAAMQQDAVANQVLFNVYRRQQEHQLALLDVMKPHP